MAPEQLRGEPVTRRADVYAASVLLWELLTGQRLFDGPNEAAVIMQVLSGERAVPPSAVLGEEAPAAIGVFDEVVMRGLAARESDRFATARDMAQALERRARAATAAQVSEWIEGLAGEVLAKRAATLAEIESRNAGNAAGRVTDPALGDDEGEPADPPGQETASNAVLPVAPRVRTGRGYAVLAAASAFLLVCGLAALPALLHKSAAEEAQAVAPRVSALAATATATASPSHDALPTVAVQDLPEAPAAAPASPHAAAARSPQRSRADATPAAAPAAAAATATAAATGTPAAKPATASAPAASPAADCNPPYTWDANGIKHYKPRCL
jgi:serine/threonine-protein kinase